MMGLLMKKSGYHYYSSGKDITFERDSIRRANLLSRNRLNPPLDNVDYLVLRQRKQILKAWFSEIDCNNLLVLDVGGRIQPYRLLLEPNIKLYIAIDLILAGLVDVVANAENLPFLDNTFDIVLCCQTLGYVRNPSLAISEMHRVLQLRGKLFLTTPAFFPEHHDELWRFLPEGLRYLTRDFSRVEIQPEGYSGAGIIRAVNVNLHRDIENRKLLRLAKITTIPFLNLLGLLLDWLTIPNTRSTSNYSLMAIK